MSLPESDMTGVTVECKISVGERYEVQNLLTYRGRIRQSESALLLQRMQTYAKEHQLTVVGDHISATFSVEQIGEEKFAEVELMLPMDGTAESEGFFFWKPRFCLEDAVKLTYAGPKEGFSAACEEMQRYMQLHGYTPVTVGYVVNKLNVGAENDVNLCVYIGTVHNIL